MAANKVNTLVDNLNTKANLNLTGEQDEQLKALLNVAVEKLSARRTAGKQLVEQIQAAVDSNDSAAAEQLLTKLREGLRQAGEGRENFLNKLDQVLQPEQRARLVVNLAQQAAQSNTPVEQLVDSLLTQGGADN